MILKGPSRLLKNAPKFGILGFIHPMLMECLLILDKETPRLHSKFALFYEGLLLRIVGSPSCPRSLELLPFPTTLLSPKAHPKIFTPFTSPLALVFVGACLEELMADLND